MSSAANLAVTTENRLAYEAMKDELLEKHEGEWVLFVDCKPLQFSKDKEPLLKLVTKPCYLKRVTREPDPPAMVGGSGVRAPHPASTGFGQPHTNPVPAGPNFFYTDACVFNALKEALLREFGEGWAVFHQGKFVDVQKWDNIYACDGPVGANVFALKSDAKNRTYNFGAPYPPVDAPLEHACVDGPPDLAAWSRVAAERGNDPRILNVCAFKAMEAELFPKFRGRWVMIRDGKLQASANTREEVSGMLDDPEACVFITRVTRVSEAATAL
jgi:hypothetical protein